MQTKREGDERERAEAMDMKREARKSPVRAGGAPQEQPRDPTLASLLTGDLRPLPWAHPLHTGLVGGRRMFLSSQEIRPGGYTEISVW